jgi:type I restriction enzyme M protein
MPKFGKTRPLRSDHFREFEAVYGENPYGLTMRSGAIESDRWRSFSRADLAARDDNLDLVWLTPHGSFDDDSIAPQEVASTIIFHLQAAIAEIELLSEELSLDPTDQ